MVVECLAGQMKALLKTHQRQLQVRLFQLQTERQIMKNISIKMTAALSIVSAVALTTAMTFYTSNTKAQASTGLTGSCGYLMNKNFNGLSNMNVGYDYMQNYIGIIDFDKKSFVGSGSHVYDYQKTTANVINETFPTQTMAIAESKFTGSYRYKLGNDDTYLTVVPTNSSNTFMLMVDYGKSTTEPSATGVCQKV